jgi:hypothetical protein
MWTAPDGGLANVAVAHGQRQAVRVPPLVATITQAGEQSGA